MNEAQAAKIAAIQQEREELFALIASEQAKTREAMARVKDPNNLVRKQFEAEEAAQVAQLKAELRAENLSYEDLLDFAASRAVRLMSATDALVLCDEMLDAREHQFWSLNEIIDKWIFVAEVKTRFIAVADDHDGMKALAKRGHPDARVLLQQWSEQSRQRGKGGHDHQRERGESNIDKVLVAWNSLSRSLKAGQRKAAVSAIRETVHLGDSAIYGHLKTLDEQGLLHPQKTSE